MAVDRVQLLLVGLPALLFFSDLSHIFAPPPPHLRHPPHQPPHHPHPPHHHHPHPPHHHHPDPVAAVIQQPRVDGAGFGTTIELQFCASCSYNMKGRKVTLLFEKNEKKSQQAVMNSYLFLFTRGTAMNMKHMLESSFPGMHVILHNYPPSLPKRVLGKVVPFLQVGAIATIMAGDQIFPKLGIVPPPWYYTLRANKFGTMATIWLFGNFAQSSLQSSGAFEVYCNGDLVFSKLATQRFPSELELCDLIGSRLLSSPFGKNMGNTLS